VVQSVSQAVGVNLGEDIVCSPQFFGLRVHDGTIVGLADKRRSTSAHAAIGS
jgi:hypothetical protein